MSIIIRVKGRGLLIRGLHYDVLWDASSGLPLLEEALAPENPTIALCGATEKGMERYGHTENILSSYSQPQALDPKGESLSLNSA